MEIECWLAGKLIAVHSESPELTLEEIKRRFGLSDRWTIRTHPSGRPDLVRTLQQGHSP